MGRCHRRTNATDLEASATRFQVDRSGRVVRLPLAGAAPAVDYAGEAPANPLHLIAGVFPWDGLGQRCSWRHQAYCEARLRAAQVSTRVSTNGYSSIVSQDGAAARTGAIKYLLTGVVRAYQFTCSLIREFRDA
jgi:hypothetical protein